MKIGVFTDLRFACSDTPTGVGKHIIYMVEGLHKSKLFNLSIISTFDQVSLFHKCPLGQSEPPLALTSIPLRWKLAEAVWTVFNSPSADKYCNGADWIYCPRNDYIPLKKIKYAVTIHGAHELDPEMPKPIGIKNNCIKIRRNISYKRIIERADLILVVSQFLKNQVLDWFHTDPSKVVVVGNGIEQVYFDTGDQHSYMNRDNQSNYLLSVGGLNTLDGGEDILNIAKILINRFPDMKIVVAGWLHEQKYLEQAKDMSNINLLGYVPAPRLAKLMKDALALLFLPKYETFGITGAEAMAVGTPIITTGGTAVSEIIGKAGIYIEQDMLDDVVEQIGEIMNKPQYTASYISEGQRLSQLYTWDNCVKRLINAIIERS
jgi:glycosyltransferase involved in cell wall biosynthesis